MKKVGIVGLGIMGRGMAVNFLKKGYTVYVWNRTEKVAHSLKKKGAIICSSPAEVAKKSDIIFEVTADDESSKKVWIEKNGILTGASSKTIFISSATLSVDWTDELINRCKKLGLNFLDIPLTGGRIGAETGTLTMLCGGKESVLRIIKPTLNAIAKTIIHFGPEGHGMRYKLILNFLQSVHIIGYGQAMAIAKASGMDLKRVSKALSERPGGIVTEIALKTYFKDPDPITFSIEWIAKDLNYAKKLAKGLDVKLLDNVLSQYKKAVKKGFSNKDWASINTLHLDE